MQLQVVLFQFCFSFIARVAAAWTTFLFASSCVYGRHVVS